MLDHLPQIGATPLSDGRCRFVVWAPEQEKVFLILTSQDRKSVPMQPCFGFHSVETDARAGTEYIFRISDGGEFPDPASRFQPEGVHGPSEVVDASLFVWSDREFQSRSLSDYIIYELHIGTFTLEGTFDAAISRMDELAGCGITAIEVMPVAQFPGNRNWGYDGVFPFAAQNTYGGPPGFQRFVDAAHSRGLSVILDVVYNHLGPEDNCFAHFGPFFTRKYSTPWGEALNFDGPRSEPVRDFFIQNALYWLTEFHIDALRLDAVHGIFDFSAHHFLAELKEKVAERAAASERLLYVIAESDLNDSRLLRNANRGGYGLDAQWSDDFHHALHVLLTGETTGYYVDFGSLADLAAVLRDGWRYEGQYSRFRERRHGNSPAGITSEHFIVFNQNHDQIGNRAMGDRLSTQVDFERLKLAAGVTLLSPFLPLIFMGEEYGETRPFQYFTSHTDLALVDAVRKGRAEEFAQFAWRGEVPDPQAEETFDRSILDWSQEDKEPHRTLRALYKYLIAIRKKFQIAGTKPSVTCDEALRTLTLQYSSSGLFVIFHFGDKAATIPLSPPFAAGTEVINSQDPRWRGSWTGNSSHQQLEFEARLNGYSFKALTSSRGFTI